MGQRKEDTDSSEMVGLREERGGGTAGGSRRAPGSVSKRCTTLRQEGEARRFGEGGGGGYAGQGRRGRDTRANEGFATPPRSLNSSLCVCATKAFQHIISTLHTCLVTRDSLSLSRSRFLCSVAESFLVCVAACKTHCSLELLCTPRGGGSPWMCGSWSLRSILC